MCAQGQRGQEERQPLGLQDLDTGSHQIEQRSIGDAQAQALGTIWEIPLVEQLVQAVAHHERVDVVNVPVLTDHQLGLVPVFA
jgi:hypothetical protein